MNFVKVFYIFVNLNTLLLVLHIEKANNNRISDGISDARCYHDYNAIKTDFLVIAMRVGSTLSFEEIQDFTTTVLEEIEEDRATSYCMEVVEKCLTLQPNIYTITKGDIRHVQPVNDGTDVARTTIFKLFYKNMAYLECFATNGNQRHEFLISTFMENQNPYPFFVFWNINLNLDNAVDLAAELYLPITRRN